VDPVDLAYQHGLNGHGHLKSNKISKNRGNINRRPISKILQIDRTVYLVFTPLVRIIVGTSAGESIETTTLIFTVSPLLSQR
jgi:hypothetical protein